MKTNVKDVKNDWLLKISRKNEKGSYDFQHISCWDKTKEEIITIANSYRSHDTIVRIYILEIVF